MLCAWKGSGNQQTPLARKGALQQQATPIETARPATMMVWIIAEAKRSRQ
jgi:hypothetical protein